MLDEALDKLHHLFATLEQLDYVTIVGIQKFTPRRAKVALSLPKNRVLTLLHALPHPLAQTIKQEDQALTDLYRKFHKDSILQWTSMGDPQDILGDTTRPAFRLDHLLLASASHNGLGARFCAHLRRDGFVALRVSESQAELWRRIETSGHHWFEQPDELKIEQAGEYGHIDRKFTGYRNGKFREQLEIRSTPAGIYPAPQMPSKFSASLALLLSCLDGVARRLLEHIAVDVGVPLDFFALLADARREDSRTRLLESSELDSAIYEMERKLADAGCSNAEEEDPLLGHSLIRCCRYDSGNPGLGSRGVLCEEHLDVGLLTLDARAAEPGLQALRRADKLWVPLEEGSASPEGELELFCMVGDTLGRVTGGYYAPCKHRVVSPPASCRIGLPFLFRGRSDAVLNTVSVIEAAREKGIEPHLAEMETTTIKELPAFESAKAILRNWFRSSRSS